RCRNPLEQSCTGHQARCDHPQPHVGPLGVDLLDPSRMRFAQMLQSLSITLQLSAPCGQDPSLALGTRALGLSNPSFLLGDYSAQSVLLILEYPFSPGQ